MLGGRGSNKTLVFTAIFHSIFLEGSCQIVTSSYQRLSSDVPIPAFTAIGPVKTMKNPGNSVEASLVECGQVKFTHADAPMPLSRI